MTCNTYIYNFIYSLTNSTPLNKQYSTNYDIQCTFLGYFSYLAHASIQNNLKYICDLQTLVYQHRYLIILGL